MPHIFIFFIIFYNKYIKAHQICSKKIHFKNKFFFKKTFFGKNVFTIFLNFEKIFSILKNGTLFLKRELYAYEPCELVDCIRDLWPSKGEVLQCIYNTLILCRIYGNIQANSRDKAIKVLISLVHISRS